MTDDYAQGRIDGPLPNKIMDAVTSSSQYTLRLVVSTFVTGDMLLAGVASYPLRVLTFSIGTACPGEQDILLGMNRLADNTFRWVLRPLYDPGVCTGTISDTPIQPNTIYTIMVTFDGSGASTLEYKTYINGQAARSFSTPKPGGWTLHSSYPMRLFNEITWGRQFHGTIFDVAVWRRTLTATEVANVFNPVIVI